MGALKVHHLKPAPGSVFLPKEAFPNPLTWTWSDTKGADLMWVPLAFERSFRMAYSRTRYGTGYYIYHQYLPGAPLSQPIKAWNQEVPAKDAVSVAAYVDLSRVWPLVGDSVPSAVQHLHAVGFWAAQSADVQSAQLRLVIG